MSSRVITIEIEIPEVPVSLTSKRIPAKPVKKKVKKKAAPVKKRTVKKAAAAKPVKKKVKKAAKKKPRK